MGRKGIKPMYEINISVCPGGRLGEEINMSVCLGGRQWLGGLENSRSETTFLSVWRIAVARKSICQYV